MGSVPIKIQGTPNIPIDVARDNYIPGLVILSSAVKKVDYIIQGTIGTSVLNDKGEEIMALKVTLEPVVIGSEVRKYDPSIDSGVIVLNKFYKTNGPLLIFTTNDIPDFLRIL